MKMRIAIAVQGRFHAFDLARALLQRGHEVTLFTNYPKWAVARFGISPNRVRSLWTHGIVFRVAWAARQKAGLPYPERWLHRWFGRWVAERVVKEHWDVLHCWSSIAEETFRAVNDGRALKLLMRCSSHVRAQARILEEEERRTGARMDRPSGWMIAREEREYGLADQIGILSSFARESFLAERVPAEKLRVLPLGARVDTFRPSDEDVEVRCQRILSGGPLRILNVGTFSLRKGMWDVPEVIGSLDGRRFEFRFVGPIATEGLTVARTLRSSATFVSTKPERELPGFYAWGDLFMLPTLEDGFQYVLMQAAAAALPILTTPNGAGTDLVRDGANGWVVPIRSPRAFVERLRWCDAHREELAAMVRRIYQEFSPRDWSDVAEDFERLCGGQV